MMEENVRMVRSAIHKKIVQRRTPIARACRIVRVRITGNAPVGFAVFPRILLPVVCHRATMGAAIRVSRNSVEILSSRQDAENNAIMACDAQTGVVALPLFPVKMGLPAYTEVPMGALRVVGLKSVAMVSLIPERNVMMATIATMMAARQAAFGSSVVMILRKTMRNAIRGRIVWMDHLVPQIAAAQTMCPASFVAIHRVPAIAECLCRGTAESNLERNVMMGLGVGGIATRAMMGHCSSVEMAIKISVEKSAIRTRHRTTIPSPPPVAAADLAVQKMTKLLAVFPIVVVTV